MATVDFVVPGRGTGRQVTLYKPATSTSIFQQVTLDYLTHTGFSDLVDRWATIDRPGRKPLTLPASPLLAKATLTVLAADPNPGVNVDQRLLDIRDLVSGYNPIGVVLPDFGKWSTTGLWVCTTMVVDVQSRVPGNSNQIQRAEVTLELTEANTPAMVKGRL